MEKIIITLNKKNLAKPGVDVQGLQGDVQELINSYVGEVTPGSTIEPRTLPVPEGAQGDGAIEWIIEILKDPGMAKIYVGLLGYFIHNLNRLLQENIKEHSETKGDENPEDDEEEKVKFSIQSNGAVKFILLPVAQKVIEEFLKSLGG